jgi:hypothetical protein
MTPDQIKAFVERTYPTLTAEPRSAPDGWAFFEGPRRGGADPNRIFRATRSSASAPTKLKLAITSRMTEALELSFYGSEEELRSLIDRELRLWHRHVAPAG